GRAIHVQPIFQNIDVAPTHGFQVTGFWNGIDQDAIVTGIYALQYGWTRSLGLTGRSVQGRWDTLIHDVVTWDRGRPGNIGIAFQTNAEPRDCVRVVAGFEGNLPGDICRRSGLYSDVLDVRSRDIQRYRCTHRDCRGARCGGPSQWWTVWRRGILS